MPVVGIAAATAPSTGWPPTCSPATPSAVSPWRRRCSSGTWRSTRAAGPTPEAPVDGMKHSGYGREGGDEGLLEFVEPQTGPRA